jgi:hypothetical protein
MINLKECVAALKDVRRSLQSDADPCVFAALDKVICKFERCVAEDDPTTAQAVREALAVISDILTCAGVAVELVKFFGA